MAPKMTAVILTSDPQVTLVFDGYPPTIRKKLLTIRKLIIDTATAVDKIDTLEETLKWGEPSYLAKGGSAVRIAWKKSKPNQYAVYFHCGTKLVETFKELYGDTLKFEGNRAIVLREHDRIPVRELKQCILLALTYHNRKHLPMLGV